MLTAGSLFRCIPNSTLLRQAYQSQFKPSMVDGSIVGNVAERSQYIVGAGPVAGRAFSSSGRILFGSSIYSEAQFPASELQ